MYLHCQEFSCLRVIGEIFPSFIVLFVLRKFRETRPFSGFVAISGRALQIGFCGLFNELHKVDILILGHFLYNLFCYNFRLHKVADIKQILLVKFLNLCLIIHKLGARVDARQSSIALLHFLQALHKHHLPVVRHPLEQPLKFLLLHFVCFLLIRLYHPIFVRVVVHSYKHLTTLEMTLVLLRFGRSV